MHDRLFSQRIDALHQCFLGATAMFQAFVLLKSTCFFVQEKFNKRGSFSL